MTRINRWSWWWMLAVKVLMVGCLWTVDYGRWTVSQAWAGVEYVTQVGELGIGEDGRQVASAVWVDVAPQVSGLELTLPSWTLLYRDKALAVPQETFQLGADRDNPKDVTVYLAVKNGKVKYRLVSETVGERVQQRMQKLQERLAEADEAIVVVWCTIPAGATDLADVPVYVLKHVRE